MLIIDFPPPPILTASRQLCLEGVSISNTYHEELTLKSKLKFALPKVDTVGLNIH